MFYYNKLKNPIILVPKNLTKFYSLSVGGGGGGGT